jgi:hypothetical protein
MNEKTTAFKTNVNNTTTYKDRIGRTDYSVREQAGQQVYYDKRGNRLGYIDSQGRTMSNKNQILSWEARPDLLLLERAK